MEFKFRRKYTAFFFLAIILHIAAVAFWVMAPESLYKTIEAKKTITLLLVVNIELLLLFYLGLFRKKYYSFHDRILIKRSFLPDIIISYKDITRIKERPSDSVILGFGKRPSFVVYYETPKRKKYTFRSDNYELLLKVIKNEMEIIRSNKTARKLTK